MQKRARMAYCTASRQNNGRTLWSWGACCAGRRSSPSQPGLHVQAMQACSELNSLAHEKMHICIWQHPLSQMPHNGSTTGKHMHKASGSRGIDPVSPAFHIGGCSTGSSPAWVPSSAQPAADRLKTASKQSACHLPACGQRSSCHAACAALTPHHQPRADRAPTASAHAQPARGSCRADYGRASGAPRSAASCLSGSNCARTAPPRSPAAATVHSPWSLAHSTAG